MQRIGYTSVIGQENLGAIDWNAPSIGGMTTKDLTMIAGGIAGVFILMGLLSGKKRRRKKTTGVSRSGPSKFTISYAG